MKKILIVMIAFCLSACGWINESSEPSTSQTSRNSNTSRPATARPDDSNGAAATAEKPLTEKAEIPATKAECLEVNTGDNVVQKNATFPIDFEPFDGACFVTSYNPEFDDPPMESEYAIYLNGKKALDLPDQFNGVTFGCWVTSVAFEDLNGDDLTDIVVTSECSAKGSTYNENMVYRNSGSAFTSSATANGKLSEFKKAGDIIAFVKKNQQDFFR